MISLGEDAMSPAGRLPVLCKQRVIVCWHHMRAPAGVRTRTPALQGRSPSHLATGARNEDGQGIGP